MPEQFNVSREAARITLDKVSSWEELNAATLQKADGRFKEAMKKYWKELAVSGVLQFDKKEGKQVLRPATDLDGNCALGMLRHAGIDTSNVRYVPPGSSVLGSINLDTGDRFGVVYDEKTHTAWFDHHEKGKTEVTSTTEIVYKMMIDLGMIEKSEALERVVDFVTKIDNRRFPSEEFLRSARTLLGLQRGLQWEQMIAYFQDHATPTEEIAPEAWEKYGLKEASLQQQKTVDEAMATLARMEKEGKVADTAYGSIIINVNNELAVGSSAAYVRHDGIINYTPGKSFAVTVKDGNIHEADIQRRLGKRFQGKVIRDKMWIYNEASSLELSLEDIIDCLGKEGRFVAVRDILRTLVETINADGKQRKDYFLSDCSRFFRAFTIQKREVRINVDVLKSILLDVTKEGFAYGDYHSILSQPQFINTIISALQKLHCVEITRKREIKQGVEHPTRMVFKLPKVPEQDHETFPDYEFEKKTYARDIPEPIVFMRSSVFDTTAMNRPFPWKGVQAWAIRREDMEDFLQVYWDGEFVEYKPDPDAVVYAVDYEESDKYVTGKFDSSLPDVDTFDVTKHVLVKTREKPGFSLFSFDEGPARPVTDFKNPYQVLIRQSIE